MPIERPIDSPTEPTDPLPIRPIFLPSERGERGGNGAGQMQSNHPGIRIPQKNVRDGEELLRNMLHEGLGPEENS